jgi:integrase
MPRQSTGAVVAPNGKRQTSFALRFNALGKRQFVTLGTPAEGWSQGRAEEELANVMADVRRGIWHPPTAPRVPERDADPTFHEFSARWLRGKEADGLRDRSIEDFRWALELHLLPYFAEFRLREIDVERVEAFKEAKVAESAKRAAAIERGRPLRGKKGQVLKPLGANSINKLLDRLAMILDLALDLELVDRNPARGKRRRLKGTKPKRTQVEVEQLPALLEVADAYLRPVLATMAGAGLRVSEAVALDWRDVNLATATLTVRVSKTDAGEGREVDMPVGLVEELAAWKARSPRTGPGDPVFVTRARDGVHNRQTKRNVEARMDSAVKAADKLLLARGIDLIEKATPHALRRLYASLRVAARDDVVYIAEQGGWEDPGFLLKVYAKAVKRRGKLSGARLEAYDEAVAWAVISAGTGREREPAGTLVLPPATPQHEEMAA